MPLRVAAERAAQSAGELIHADLSDDAVVSLRDKRQRSNIIGNIRSTRGGRNTGTAVPLIKREKLAERIA